MYTDSLRIHLFLSFTSESLQVCCLFVLCCSCKLLHLYAYSIFIMETTDLSVIKNRIDLIRQKKGMNLAEFAEAISVGRATITHITQGRNNPSLEVIMKIINRFPEISIDWLLNGKGEMEQSAASSASESASAYPGENGIFPSEGREQSENPKEMPSRMPGLSHELPVKEVVKYVEKPERKIVEIRIFFDDNTFEIFKSEI